MLYTLFVSASAAASKSGVAAKANTPPEVNVKSAASVPARVVLKVGVVPSASEPARVATESVPSAIENELSEVNAGVLSFTLVTLTMIASVPELVPSLATTFNE